MGIDGVFSDHVDRMVDALAGGDRAARRRPTGSRCRRGARPGRRRGRRSCPRRWGRSSGCRVELARLSPITKHVVLGDRALGTQPDSEDRRGRDAVGEVGLLERLAVDVDVAVATRDGLARQADDPLDEVLDRRRVPHAVGALEHDDVAAVDVVELVAELVDEDPVADRASVGSIDPDGM